MAGSYLHCCNTDGTFRTESFYDLIENLGDAYEACEEMYWMIDCLAHGDRKMIEAARKLVVANRANAGF